MEAKLSTPQEDPLYKVFEEHLHSGLYDLRPSDALVRDVVDYYWRVIFDAGHVPHRLHEFLRVDLIQDVQDMLKAKIYGHYGIAEYNRVRKKKQA
jgi:hypothetical protein